MKNPSAVTEVVGSAYPDTILGNGGGDTLIGNGGADYLDGRGGGALIEGAETQVVYLNFLPGAVDYSSQATRDAIEARIAAIYGDFDYSFTQARPTSGLYAELDFNVPAGSYLGGEATGLDWRNLDLGGSATIDISQFLQFPGTDLVGVAGLPAATAENIINMTATIAAHELGHLSGLLHEDAFGPIGSGVSTALLSNTNLDGFYPAYGGPVGGDETMYHVMGSPASVGTSLYDATRVTFFGEREAVKLAFADSGDTVVESAGAIGSAAAAQALTLAPLDVPTTLLLGQNLGDTFDVSAVDVDGAIALGADGTSSVDYYTFTATAGQLFNFEALSQTITRDNGNAIDPVLTLLESDGKTVVPYGTFVNGAFVPSAGGGVATDDDSFQDQDSVLYDVTMPYSGTYYVQVKSYAGPDQFGIEHDSGAGRYDLFLYSFTATPPASVQAFDQTPAATPSPTAGDTLIGGSGKDTLVGSSADDLFAVAPGDSVVGGSGTGLVDSLPTALSVSGTPSALTGSFVASDPALSYTATWHVTGSNGRAIADVSRSYPAGTLSQTVATALSYSLPSGAGLYAVSFTVTDGLGISRSATTTETVGNPLTAAVTLGSSAVSGPILDTVGTPVVLDATAGSTFSWTATLAGSSTPQATGSGSSFAFSPGSSGTYTVSLTASDGLGDLATASVSVIVAAPSVQMLGVPSNLYEAEGSPFTLSSLVNNAPANSSLSWTVAVGTGPASSPVTTPSFTYTPADIGSYTVTLSLLDASGHPIASTSQQIIGIGVAPVASIGGGPGGGISPEGTALSFSATATSPSAATMANGFYYEWTVDYGTFTYTTTTTTTLTTSPSPFSFTPGQAGTYVVHLSAFDYHGFQGQDATETIVVTAVPTLVSITGLPAGSTAIVGSTLSLGASVTAPTADLQDAGFVDTWTVLYGGTVYGPYSGPSLNLTANGVGLYAITLTSQDAEGVSGSTTALVDVADTAPQVNPSSAFLAYTQGVASTFSLGAVIGPIQSLETGTVLVDWGDHTDSSYTISSPGVIPPASHVYDQPGTYPVVVTVTDAFGLKGVGLFQAIVSGVTPSPSILGLPSSVTAGTSVSLGSSVSDASLAETKFGFSYAWSATKNGSPYSFPGNPATNLASFSFQPSVGGTYVVSLAVTDHNGQVGTTSSAPITVINPAPTVSIVGLPTGSTSIAGTAVSLSSSVSSAIANNTFTYAWSATTGGSTVATGTSASFAFTPTAAGSYTVTLVVTDLYNNSGSASAGLSVTTATPLVGVTASNATYTGSAYTGTPVTTVNGTSTTTGVSYTYTAQGSTTSIPAPTHAGSYTVTANYAGSGNYTAGSASANFSILAATTSVAGSVAGTSFGNSTLTATVTSAAGTPAGSVDFYDSTTSTDLGSATLDGTGKATLTLAVPLETGSQSIALTFAASTADFAASSSTIGVSEQASIYVLSRTASAALSVSGSSTASVPGTIQVDSSSASAIVLSGSSKLTASSIGVVGGTSVSGSSGFGVTPTKGVVAFADPLAGLLVPSATGLTTHSAVNLGGSSSLTISPGIYPSITVGGSGKLTLQPGVYVITGGGLSVSGSGVATGSGVLIYNAGSNYNGGSGTTFGSVTMSGSGTLNLTPMTTGIYAGIAIFQSRDNAKVMSISGAAITGLNGGTIYAPAATLTLSGSTQVGGSGVSSSLIVNELALSGATGAFQLTDGAETDSSVSVFNWITNPVLTVAAQDDTGAGLDPAMVSDLGLAMAYLNQALASFGVDLSWAAPGTNPDVTVHFASTTPEGGAADGVLGYTTAQDDVYIVTGWNYCTSSDPSQVGPGQFDFPTLAIHELAHTLGLGESQDPSSVMYEYLAPATARRTFTDSNLSLIDTDADRYMKVASPAPGPNGVSLPLASLPVTSLAVSASPTLDARANDSALAALDPAPDASSHLASAEVGHLDAAIESVVQESFLIPLEVAQDITDSTTGFNPTRPNRKMIGQIA